MNITGVFSKFLISFSIECDCMTFAHSFINENFQNLFILDCLKYLFSTHFMFRVWVFEVLPAGLCSPCISGHMFFLGLDIRDNSFEQFAFQMLFEYSEYTLHAHYNLYTLIHFPKNEFMIFQIVTNFCVTNIDVNLPVLLGHHKFYIILSYWEKASFLFHYKVLLE